MNAPAARRKGDAIPIEGAYQHVALTRGHPVQRFWHHSKLLLLDWMFPIQAPDRVLDVGCGSGVFAAEMARRGAHVLGIDANAEAVRYAAQTFAGPESNQPNQLSFRLGLLDELALPSEGFDKAVCLEVIEHVYPAQVRALLDSLFRILRPGGKLLITTPNYRGLWPLIEWGVDRFSQAAKMDGEQHVTHFHRALLLEFLQKAGFEVERACTYSTFAPFLAAGSRKLAERMEQLERRVDLPFGNLLVAVARKPD